MQPNDNTPLDSADGPAPNETEACDTQTVAMPAPQVRIDLVLDDRVNVAMQHNAVPVVKLLTLTLIEPDTEEASPPAVPLEDDAEASPEEPETAASEPAAPLEDVEVRLSLTGELSEVWSRRIDRLDPGRPVTFETVDLPLRGDTLAHCTERERATLVVEVRAGESVIAERREPVDVLAFDEWAGLGSLPEILAAFVTPNHPAIERLLGDARKHLELATGDGALSGYQRRGPARVRAIVQAIYRAVGDCAIGYINPPASFETTGQRVRLPDQLLERKLGTCLDLTLLLAGLFEQAGLNPLIVMVKGHALVAVWLGDEWFPEPAVAEPLRLRKRVQLGEVLALETTLLTQSPAAPLELAEREAARRLEDVDAFHYAVDVRSARSRAIRPLPLRVKPGTYDLIDLERVKGVGAAEFGDDVEASPVTTGAAEASPPGGAVDDTWVDDEFAMDVLTPTAPRIERWKRKLLDLSLRNRILNYRDTKKSIPLACPDLSGLEDRLAEGERFDIRPKTDVMAGADPRSPELHEERSGQDAIEQHLRDELGKGRIHAELTENELDKRLVEIYRAARLSLEESGANTLYLAVGFLSWYETPTSEPARRAPILLLPVTLERLPAQRGYRLSLSEDEARINVTLLEKLRSEYQVDIDGLDELTLDEAGLDVPAILKRFREVVKDIARWDVIEQSVLGLFSFTKFLMWRDLQDRSTQLMQSPVVRHLVEPGSEGAGLTLDQPLPEPAELDGDRPPHETLCPTDADSSQLAAVFAADDGHSFVLEGPPGTGKSQTITNLIAHALAKGKRVLFVSEKMAALGVVQKRLSRMGLGPFCLELHSNHSNKRGVLEQLEEALNVAGAAPPEHWRAEADRLGASRTALNGLVQALHIAWPIGLSVYQVTTRLIGMRGVPAVDLGLDAVTQLSAQRLADMLDAAHRLSTAASAVGAIDQHPYRAARVTGYRSDLPDTLKTQCAAAEQAVRGVSDAAGTMLDALKLDSSGAKVSAAELSAETLHWLIGLGELLQEAPRPTAQLLAAPDYANLRQQIEQQITRGEARDAERDRLFARYEPKVLEDDLPALRAKLADGMTALPVLSWFKCYGPRKRVSLVLKSGTSVPANAALLNDLDALIKLKAEDTALAAEDNPGRVYTGEAWRDGQAAWDEVRALLDWSGRYSEHLTHAAARAFGDAATIEREAARLALDDRDALLDNDGIHQHTDRLRDAMTTLDDRLEALNTLMHADTALAWGPPEDAGYLDIVSTTLEDWQTGTARLRDWTHWCATREIAEDHDLGPLIGAYRVRSVSPSQFDEVVERGVLTQWHAAVCDAEPALGNFHSGEHARQIAEFRAIDQRYLKLTAQQVHATLAERVPLLFGEPTAHSEVGILKRQLKLKRRHMPVRKLIRELPNLLPRLKPCLLMSPLSVAQYLDTHDTAPPFDLIVFDEASQIPVWDAVGAIARGKSCVIVGDSKQLPPTSFFQKLESDDDEPGSSTGPDENDFVELESILDECVAAGLPTMRLRWHYRSRHESLIAFSNVHYYQGELNTFPSPIDETDTLGVCMRYIPEAHYDRGKTRTNPIEAEHLVAEVVDRLKGYTLGTYQSIGIVTFSMAQQTLIEDLLDAARREHPEIDPFFSPQVEEPVFIKNLENVQGDERAEIFFSICYGPDSTGKVAMNFGPLNREGGERRLNVAITRARRRVAVFTSLRADQIDLSRTQQVGVKHLRSFLDYADRGASAIGEASSSAGLDGSAFESAVASALRDKGHTVALNVGMSGYRVSLAVRDPQQPGRYLVGIECDGPYYRNAPAARDRDRTRPSVMRGLSWRLHRLWSLDWWHDPQRELAAIEDAIARAVRNEPEPELAAAAQHQSPATGGTKAAGIPRMIPGMDLYKPYLPSKPSGDSDQFYADSKTASVQRSLLRVAKQEAPIHRELLARRVLYCWQVTRLTGKAQARVDEVIQQAVDAGQLWVDGPFVWLGEQDKQSFGVFRVPGDGEEPTRHIEEIPPAEVCVAAVAVLKQMIALPREELDREVAVLFGFSRVTGRVQPTIDAAVQRLLDEGRCVLDGAGNVALG